MRYFPKSGALGVALVQLSIALSIFLLPALVWAGHVRVGIVPWNVNGPEDVAYLSGALTDMISSRVGSSDAVQIVRKDLVAKETGGLNIKDMGGPEMVALAKKLNADFLIYGSVSVLGESVSLDAKLLEVSTGELTPLYSTGTGISSIVKLTQTLSNDALGAIRSRASTIKPDLSYTGKFKADKAGEDSVVKIKATTAPGVELPGSSVKVQANGNGDGTVEPVVVITRKTGGKTLKRRSTNIDGLFVSMTAADLDGDGTDEIFMTSSTKLIVASYGIEGLKIIKEFKSSSGVQNLFLSSGDTDSDGTEEVYLARLVRGKPASISVKYSRGSFMISEVTGLDYLLRVIDIEGEGAGLIGQGFRAKSGFFRKVIKFKKEGDAYKETGKLNLPKSVARQGISGFQIIDIDKDGTNEIVTLGKRGKLRVYKAGARGRFKEFWRSPDEYGGSLNELKEPDHAGVDESISEDAYFMPTEIKYGDFDSDGVKEIILKKNLAGGLGKYAKRVMFYDSGSLKRLSWNVALFEEEWKTRDISGYIADFIISDLDNDGIDEVTILVVESQGGLLKRDKMHSYLLSYSIQ